jgi:hypothetical protein
MNKVFIIIMTIINLGICERKNIITIAMGKNLKGFTTGNGNYSNTNLAAMHLPYDEENPIIPFEEEQKFQKTLKYYNNIKNKFIIDFANEDPKVFRPDKEDYWYVASKRGYFFDLAAVCSMFFIFWVFILRLAYGECGGYKYIIRKPSKSERYTVMFILLGGLVIFTTGMFVVNYYMIYDKSNSTKIGNSLVSRNEEQLKTIQNKKTDRFEKGVIEKISSINKMKMDIIYSVLSYERFKIGAFLDDLIPVYQESINNAEEINKSFFIGMKSQIYSRTLIILLGVLFILFTFIYAYRKRKVLISLVLTLLLFFLIIFSFNTLSTSFNVWTISLEICDQTTKVFKEDEYGEIRFKNHQTFNKILTCLSTKDKKILKSQMLSLLIAQNTLINIMKNYLMINVKEKVDFMETASSIHANYQKLLLIFKNSAKENNIYDQLLNFLSTFRTINELYNKLEKLDRCYQLKQWANQVNNSLCKYDVSYQYYIMWGFIISIVGIFVIAVSMFFAENVIRGIYNEEIQYVKTNKLRYDWN